MKGLKSKGENKTYYVAPNEGKLTLSSKTPKDGYEKREFTDKDGNTVVKYLLEFDELTVMLADAKAEETKFGKRWSVKGINEDEVYFLQFPYSSGYSRSFFNQLENIDLTKPVTITASYKEQEYQGKMVPNTALWVHQNGNWVGFKYSKENPGDRPAWKTIQVKGKDQQDDSDIQKFYENVATRLFNELKLNNDKQAASDFFSSEIDGSEVNIPEGSNQTDFIDLPEDDGLPF